MQIPVIDLFAGPGGLAEGFSKVKKGNDYFFDIKLSIEKEPEAYKTLKLRSFYRQFIKRHEDIPESYYEVLRAKKLKAREAKLTKLYEL
jgi:DNA (cytosine-5)-methyltransferase 1